MNTTIAEVKLLELFNYKSNIVMPTISRSVLDFEGDIVVISPNNILTIVEIKMTLNDLKNDLKKQHIISYGSELFGKYFGKITHFYYAVPEFLIDDAKKQIPDFAGLINLTNNTIIVNPDRLSIYVLSSREVFKIMAQCIRGIYNLKIESTKFTETDNYFNDKYEKLKLMKQRKNNTKELKLRVLKCRSDLKKIGVKKQMDKFALKYPEFYKDKKAIKRLNNLWYNKITDENFTKKLELFVEYKKSEY